MSLFGDINWFWHTIWLSYQPVFRPVRDPWMITKWQTTELRLVYWATNNSYYIERRPAADSAISKLSSSSSPSSYPAWTEGTSLRVSRIGVVNIWLLVLECRCPVQHYGGSARSAIPHAQSTKHGADTVNELVQVANSVFWLSEWLDFNILSIRPIEPSSTMIKYLLVCPREHLLASHLDFSVVGKDVHLETRISSSST